MVQAAIIPIQRALPRSEKFAPHTQEVRTRFARIKRELRRLRRLLGRRPAEGVAASKA
jgi:hypothetical protein